MNWRILKIFSLALLPVLIVFGATAGQKGGGAGNQDIPLKATFSPGPFGPIGPEEIYLDGKFRNDKDEFYVHQGTKSGQNQILISQPASTGRFIMVIYRTASGTRYLNLHLDSLLYPPVAINDLPSECDCLHPYFIYDEDDPDGINILSPIQTTFISISTTWECQRFDYSDGEGPYAELIPIPKQYLNFAKMNPGDTKYACGFGNVIKFRTMNDPNTENYDESLDNYNLWVEPQFFVIKAFGNQGGVTEWTITPFAERYKAIVPINNVKTLVDFPFGGIPRRVTSSSYTRCNHGTFLMPFELKIVRK